MHVTSVHVPVATSNSQWDDIKEIVGGVQVLWKEWYLSICSICAVDQVRGSLYNDLYICRLHRYWLVAIGFIVARIGQETLKQIGGLWKVYTLCSHKTKPWRRRWENTPVHIMMMHFVDWYRHTYCSARVAVVICNWGGKVMTGVKGAVTDLTQDSSHDQFISAMGDEGLW